LAGPNLPTSITAGFTTGHAGHHVTAHQYINKLDTTFLTESTDGDVLTYDSTSGTWSGEAPGAGSTDPEVVRDTIGGALSANTTLTEGTSRRATVTITPDDAANTIAIGVTTSEEMVQIDSFTGATDRAKFTAAMTYMAAQTRKRALQFPPRTFASGGTPLLGGNVIFSGLRLYGPAGNDGPKNLEISSGNLVDHRVHLNTGTGTSAFLRGDGTDIYDFELRNIAFQWNVPGQLVHNSTGNLYVPNFHSLTYYGCTSAFGSNSTKCLMTQYVFSGHHTAVGFTDTLMQIGGSDGSLFMGGFLNANSGGTGAGKPIIILDNVGKTNIGGMYITNEGDWTGVRIGGTIDDVCNFYGGWYEGRNTGTPATRPVFDIQGGTNNFFGIWTAFVDDAGGTANGVIHQSGGIANFYAPSYLRTSAVADTFPWLYQTGGTAFVDKPIVCTTGEQMRLRWSTAVTDTVALPANGYRA
jgi:hypothetical protein